MALPKKFNTRHKIKTLFVAWSKYLCGHRVGLGVFFPNILIIFTLLSVFTLSAYTKEADNAASDINATKLSQKLEKVIHKLQEKKIRVGNVSLTVEIAKTPEQQQRGLMFRKHMPHDHGMLFEFGNEEVRNFWMKNTFIPLSIGFFNTKKELIDIQDMSPVVSEMQTDVPSYQSAGAAKYALEVNVGWFKKNKVSLGNKLHLE